MFEKIKGTIQSQELVKDLTALKELCIKVNEDVREETSKTLGPVVTELLLAVKKVRTKVEDMVSTHFQSNPPDDEGTSL